MLNKLIYFIHRHNTLIFLVLFAILSSIFGIIYLASNGNQFNEFDEVVMNIAYSGSLNKTPGFKLVSTLSFLGIAAYSLFYLIFKYPISSENENIKTTNISKTVLIILGLVTFITYVFWYYPDYSIAFAFIFVFIVYFISKENVLNGLILFLINLYTLFACYRLYALFFDGIEISHFVVLLTAFLLSCLLLIPKNKSLFISKYILISQLILPFLLLVYTFDKHKLEGMSEIISISALPQINVFIWLLISAFLIEAIYLIKKHWDKNTEINTIMSFGACVSIMGFNLCKYIGAVVPHDIHHPYENIIGFHQIFQMGQTLFDEYIPISGLYSIFHGAIFKFFGNGLISQFINTDNVLCLIISIIIVFLLKAHTNNIGRFLVSVCFLFVCCYPHYIHYDRVLFILPIMLFLSAPKLIEDRNLWLCIFISSSLLHCLYYPLFGFAICMGFLPLGIYQVINFIKYKEFTIIFKKIKYFLAWSITFITTIFSLPLLFKLYNHMKVMASQTMPYGGASRFGQDFNAFFLQGFPIPFKIIVLYILSYVFPAFLILVIYATTLKVLNINKNKIEKENIKPTLLMISLVIIPLLTFPYTMLRLEKISLYVRGEAIIIAMIIMFIFYVKNYINNIRLKYALICFSVCVIAISYSWGFKDNSSKLMPYYKISNENTFLKNDTDYKIGTGFVETEIFEHFQDICHKINRDNTYFAADEFGLFYICDIRGISLLETNETISYPTQELVIKDILKHKSVIGTGLDTIRNYYLFNWIITSGKYIWDTDLQLFVPNDKNLNIDEVNKLNSQSYLGADYSFMVPAALAEQFDNIAHFFDETNIKFSYEQSYDNLRINFENEIKGSEADFLYIELEGYDKDYTCSLYDDLFGFIDVYDEKECGLNKYLLIRNYTSSKCLTVSYIDDDGIKHELFSNLYKGKLLIPIGACGNWLSTMHSYINIKISDDNIYEYIKINPIKEIRLLKLKGIQTNEL